jgi:hypothetical protein
MRLTKQAPPEKPKSRGGFQRKLEQLEKPKSKGGFQCKLERLETRIAGAVNTVREFRGRVMELLVPWVPAEASVIRNARSVPVALGVAVQCPACLLPRRG